MSDKNKFLPEFDVAKLMGDMKLPAVPDVQVVMAAYKRNLDALSEANRVAQEGAQAVARRHMEILQATMSGLTENLKDLSTTNPAGRAAKQAELLKKAYENAVSNTRELGDLIQKSNAEAIGKLNGRFSEALAELKTLLDK